jgi:hypothetical protein
MNTKERVTQSSPVNFLPGLIDIFLKKNKGAALHVREEKVV